MSEIGDLRVRDVQRAKVGPGEVLVFQIDDPEPDVVEAVIEHLRGYGVAPVLVIPTGAKLRVVEVDLERQHLTVKVVP